MDVDGFKQYCESQVERQGGGMTEATADNYSRDVARFADWYGQPDEPDPDDVRDYIYYLARERQVANSTIQKYFAAIRKYFYYKQRLDEIEQVSQWVGDQYPKGGAGTPDSFADDELNALRDTAQSDPRTSAMVALLSTLGMRVSELVALTLDDITYIEDADDPDQFPDWTEGLVTITRAKRREDVHDDMPIGSYERDELERYIDSRGEYLPDEDFARATDWLFPTYHDGNLGHMSTKNARVLLSNLADETDHPGISSDTVHPHKFRHTVGTRLGKQGMSAQQIAKYLGQANSASAEVYVHLDRSDVVGMREGMEG